MKYTECKWHKYPEDPPVRDGYYIVSYQDNYGGAIIRWDGKWAYPRVDFWSEIPANLTNGESDQDAYDKFVCNYRLKKDHSSIDLYAAFMAGCKSARERMNK